MHHCTDVLAGSIIGISFAVLMVNNTANIITKFTQILIEFHLIQMYEVKIRTSLQNNSTEG